jgi:hypothetical protein
MRGIASQPRGIARLARAFGLDHNPLRRASDRAEAWIRVGLVAIFLIVGPLAALDAAHGAHHAGITGAPVQDARTHRVTAGLLQSVHAAAGPAKANGSGLAGMGARWEDTGSSVRTDEVFAGVTALALLALALLAALRLTVMFLNRLRLAAWETAWSRVGPQWTEGRLWPRLGCRLSAAKARGHARLASGSRSSQTTMLPVSFMLPVLCRMERSRTAPQ